MALDGTLLLEEIMQAKEVIWHAKYCFYVLKLCFLQGTLERGQKILILLDDLCFFTI